MAVQNSYNNYMKRQNKKPINNFKEKVKNSLSGVPTEGTIGDSANTPKARTVAPMQTSSLSTLTQKTGAINPLDNPSKPNPVTPNPVTTPVETPAPQATGAPTQGLVSNDVINDAYSRSATNQQPSPVNTPPAPSYKNPDGTPKTPQQLAQELLEQQKLQMQKDWEIKQQQLEQQKNQAQDSFNQSVTDGEGKYKETVDTMNQNRYDQMQDLAVSGSKRGIQYSPQQLGLENVANINHNKNLAEASKQRNDLLNKLQIEINNVMGNINLGLQDATNNYNKALGELSSSYNKQMMDWSWDEKTTKEEREWQEQQTLKDREFQQMMAEMQNKWQAEQNALDRGQGRSARGGGGWSGGRSFTPWSKGRRSFSAWDNWKDYGGYSTADMSDTDYQDAFVKNALEASTDMYNAIDTGGMNDLNERAGLYSNEMDKVMKTAKSQGVPDNKLKEIKTKRDTALKHAYNKSYARDTNTSYKIKDTVHENKTPVRDSYKKKVVSNKVKDRRDYSEKYNVKMSNTKTPANRLVHDKFAYDDKIAKKVKEQSKKKPTPGKSTNKSQAQKVKERRNKAFNNLKKKVGNLFKKKKKKK